MPENTTEKLSVNVNVEISAASLQAIVVNAKRLVPRNSNGTYCVDTADQVSVVINRFLKEKDFDRYVRETVSNHK